MGARGHAPAGRCVGRDTRRAAGDRCRGATVQGGAKAHHPGRDPQDARPSPGALTGPVDGPASDAPASDEPAVPGPGTPDATRPGVRTFSLDGRRAPGLYLVGWLATALGGPLLGVAIVSGSSGFGGLFLVVVGALLLGLGLTAAAGAQAIERRERQDLVYRGPSPFLVFGASVPLTILVELPFQLAGSDLRTPLGTLVAVALIGAIWLGLLGMTVVGTGALRWREIATGIVETPIARIAGDGLVGAAAAIPVILATSIVAAILVSATGVTPEGPIAAPTDASALILGLLAAAVVAPISEELFYRGFATTAWMRSFGPGRAIVQGALFFAFVHVLTLSGADFDHAARAALVAFGARLPVAFALGWIFVSRRSLAASIGLHATFNGLLVVLSALSVSAAPG